MKKIIFNHKSYLSYGEIKKYKKEIEDINFKKEELIIFPSMPYLALFKNSKYSIGAQNFFNSSYSSFTGETNLEALKSMGVKYVLVGHSERKRYLRESPSFVRSKVKTSLEEGSLITVLCVGEEKPVTNPGRVVKNELDDLVSGIELENLKKLVVAYEPIWAVGGEQTQDIKAIKEVVKTLKDYMKTKYKLDTEVLYGGSVSTESVNSILKVTDGILLGRKSAEIKKARAFLRNIKSK